MTIKLPIEKVREFLSLSKFVSTEKSDVLPVLKYVRFEIVFGTCIVTKMNFSAFCKHSFDAGDCEDCEFLIEEKHLLLICNQSKQQFVSVTLKDDGTVNVTDGYYKYKCNPGINSPQDYPKIPDTSNNERVRINKHILECLDTAKIHVTKDPLYPQFNPVYFKDNDVYSGSHHMTYCKTFTELLPTISISQNECSLLAALPFVDFCKADNYNTYKFQNTVYGYIQPENANGFPYRFLLDRVAKENYIKIKVEDLINFCVSTMGFAESSDFCNSSLIIESETTANLLFQDKSRDEENSIDVGILLKGEPFEFAFSPSQILPMLKSLPYDYICIGNEQNMLSIWSDGDESYIGILNKINL